MGKLMKYWKLISVWKKTVYISLLGTFLWFLYGAINTIIFILNNKTGIYQCAISIERPCGLSKYLLKSDSSILFYISVVLVMIGLLRPQKTTLRQFFFLKNHLQFWLVAPSIRKNITAHTLI